MTNLYESIATEPRHNLMNDSQPCCPAKSNVYLQMTLKFSILFLRETLHKQHLEVLIEWPDDEPQVHWFESEKRKTEINFY